MPPNGPTVKALIDGLFKVKQGETSSTWNLLKREPKKPTNKETRRTGWLVLAITGVGFLCSRSGESSIRD